MSIHEALNLALELSRSDDFADIERAERLLKKCKPHLNSVRNWLASWYHMAYDNCFRARMKHELANGGE